MMVRVIFLMPFIFWLMGCGPAPVTLGMADYPALNLKTLCVDNLQKDLTEGKNKVVSDEGIHYSVRVPANYNNTKAHPLLIVYSPAGKHRFSSENFIGLTREITSLGIIVAYVNHLPLSMQAFERFGKIPDSVSVNWCIDESKVFLAGHSDGGTTALAVNFLNKMKMPINGLIVSGAGIRGEDLTPYQCPKPTKTLLIHSGEDTVFPPPKYGLGPLNWLAKCNKCSDKQVQKNHECIEYLECKKTTKYCQTSSPHEQWPDVNLTLLEFLAEQP